MTRYLDATQSLCLGKISSLIFVSFFWIYDATHLKISSKTIGDIRNEKEKELIMQLQIFHEHIEFTILFLLRINIPYPKSFLYFLDFFWSMHNIFPIDNLVLSRSWTKYFKINLMFIFSFFPLLIYDEWWIMCFTKKLFEFVAPCSKFYIIESFRLVKSRFVPKKSTSGKTVDEILEGCVFWAHITQIKPHFLCDFMTLLKIIHLKNPQYVNLSYLNSYIPF